MSEAGDFLGGMAASSRARSLAAQATLAGARTARAHRGAAARAQAVAHPLRPHRRGETAFAGRRSAQGGGRGRRGRARCELCARGRRGGVDSHRAQSLRWLAERPGDRLPCARRALGAGDAQGFPGRRIPGARGTRCGRQRRARHPAHDSARRPRRAHRYRARASTCSCCSRRSMRPTSSWHTGWSRRAWHIASCCWWA